MRTDILEISAWTSFRSSLLRRRVFILLIAAWAVAITTACVNQTEFVRHEIEFDTRYDDQDAFVLDFKYMLGDKVIYGTPDEYVKKGAKYGRDGSNGPMNRGTSLYVRWVNKVTGKVYEDTVDLRHRLPADIKDKDIYFMIWGAQLYVYIVQSKTAPSDELEKRHPGEKFIGPRMYMALRTIQIYPDQPKR